MKRLRNIHPGEILSEEFLIPLKITAYRRSKEIAIPQTRISEIIKGNRRTTADTALRLSRFFGNSAKFWLRLQGDFDIEDESKQNVKTLRPLSDLTATLHNGTFAPDRQKFSCGCVQNFKYLQTFLCKNNQR